jgi:hypothetical protein
VGVGERGKIRGAEGRVTKFAGSKIAKRTSAAGREGAFECSHGKSRQHTDVALKMFHFTE